MPDFYTRYQQGFYTEVYDELLLMGKQVFESRLYEDALQVMQEIMKRVSNNIELLIPRLHSLGYIFRKGGFWENVSIEKQVQLEKEYPLFQLPTAETLEQVAALEQLTGPLPLSLKCFFEEVGCVNFIGLFPTNERQYGCVMDPLCINSVEIALQMVTGLKQTNLGDLWAEEPLLMLTGDSFHKYGYSGSGSYTMRLPSISIDTFLLDEPHNTTFVNYLRICMRWGGFPGFEKECRLSKDELEYLTKDLLPF
jgi:hypothetical protein